MSQALSIKAQFLDSAAARPSLPRGSGVSPESKAVREAVDAIERSVERSQSLFGRKAAVIAQIWAIVNDCAEPGWDGNGAEPADRRAAFVAADFVRSLPSGVPLPEVAPEPDGSISLDWIRSRNNVFSLSVGTSGRLAYAWIDGSDRGHGVARFDRDTVPTRILQGISEIAAHGDAALGSS